jgi:hypothetical protein
MKWREVVGPLVESAVIGVNTALGCITPPTAPVLIFTSYFPKLVLSLPHIVLGTPW